MAERANAVQEQYLAKQSGFGTLGGSPAWKKLAAAGFDQNINTEGRELIRSMGNRAGSGVTDGEEWSSGQGGERPTYNEMGYLLSMLYGAPTTTTPSGATIARQHVWKPPLGGAYDPVFYAHQRQDGSNQELTLDNFLRALTVEWRRKGGVTFSAEKVGRILDNTASAISGATVLANNPLFAKKTKVFYDPTAGALGTTKMPRAMRASFQAQNYHDTIFPLDSDEASWAAAVNDEATDELSIWLPRDSSGSNSGNQVLAAMRANSRGYVRVITTGATLDGTPAVKETLQLDCAVEVLEPGDTSDEQKLYGNEWRFACVYDATLAYYIKWTLINGMTY